VNSSIDWTTFHVDDAALGRVGALVAAESRPITDHRSSAEYRRHAVGVLARRLVRRSSVRGVAA